MGNFNIFQLSNGLRVVHLPTQTKLSHIGLIVDAGTRDEIPEQNGLAHFIEHSIFKGTKKRKPFHILSRLDRVGGELNAYTGKEDTTIHASFLSYYFDRAAEIISDITFNSTFPKTELEKEKEVILDEIDSYKDSPSELIFDEFEEHLYENHPLALPVLGSEKTVRKLTRKHILDFIVQHYTIERMVLCTASDISLNKVKATLEKHFGHIQTEATQKRKSSPVIHHTFNIKKDLKTHQAHCILGNHAYDIHHPLKNATVLLNNLLGGPGLNCLLNLQVREKLGIAYNIESSYQPYTDGGEILIYLGTDASQVQKSLKVIRGILKKLCDKKLGILQLHLAKKQLTGHMALAQDSTAGHILTLGKSLLLFDKIDADEEIEKRIQAITAKQVLEAANELFSPEKMSTLIYQ